VRVLVAGMVAADPHQGGATWAVLQYVRGFEELGHEVWLVDPGPVHPASSAYFARLGLGRRAFFGVYDGPVPDVLVNLSGVLREEIAPIRVYLDLDPFFTQTWHAQGVDVGLEGHTHYVTVGRAVPRTGHDWIHTLPPVVLSAWPVASHVSVDAFTTVANLRSYGPVEIDGVRYGQKAHSLRGLLELPAITGDRFAIALDAHPDEPDLASLREHGWELLDPHKAAGTPERYAAFVGGSRAEIALAKEGYVASDCGWFSDRSAVYLASGRPVVAQDTGFGESLPVGAGLFAFSDVDGAAAAIETVGRDYARHARASRAIAEEHLDARRVLARLLREVGATTVPVRRSIHDVSNTELEAMLGVEPIGRRPFEYRSSAPIAEVDAGGRTLLVKDLSRDALTERGRAAKLPFLHDPRREPEVYRSLLVDAGLGTARLDAAVVDQPRGRFWLAVEKVAGEPLYQLDLDRWPEVARWLARCHDRFTGISADWLIRYDRAFFELWPERAGVDLPGYESVVGRLCRLPTTLVHGDLYPSNVLVAPDRVCPVDWELAGIGPGVLDLAALSLGLPDHEIARLAEAYRCELAEPPTRKSFAGDLACARLQLAVQWLGWSPEWIPPPEHARDWRAELSGLAEQAGLL
jgi:hypothetical protein